MSGLFGNFAVLDKNPHKDAVFEQFLKEKGFSNIESVVDDKLNVKKLIAGRIDLWINSQLSGIQVAKEAVGDSAKIQDVFEIQTTPFFIAFSKSTPDDIIAKWQSVLDEIKNDGTYDSILKKYL